MRADGTRITGGQDASAFGIPNLHWAFGTEIFKYLIFDDPEFDYSRYDFANWDEDIPAADQLFSATDTDLSGLREAGGRHQTSYWLRSSTKKAG